MAPRDQRAKAAASKRGSETGKNVKREEEDLDALLAEFAGGAPVPTGKQGKVKKGAKVAALAPAGEQVKTALQEPQQDAALSTAGCVSEPETPQKIVRSTAAPGGINNEKESEKSAPKGAKSKKGRKDKQEEESEDALLRKAMRQAAEEEAALAKGRAEEQAVAILPKARRGVAKRRAEKEVAPERETTLPATSDSETREAVEQAIMCLEVLGKPTLDHNSLGQRAMQALKELRCEGTENQDEYSGVGELLRTYVNGEVPGHRA